MCQSSSTRLIPLPHSSGKKGLQIRQVKLTLSSISHSLWRGWAFLSAPNILCSFTDLSSHSHPWVIIPMSYYCALSCSQYNSSLPSTLSQRLHQLPPFSGSLLIFPHHSPIHPRICSLLKQLMQTSPCVHRPWMKHQVAQISVPVNTPAVLQSSSAQFQ